MDIEGFSEKTGAKLVELGLVKQLDDIYRALTAHPMVKVVL